MRLVDVTSEKWEFIIDRPEKQKQGIHLYYKGVPYPRRVYYDRLNDPNYQLRALEALGTVKKFIFGLTYLSDIVIPRTLRLKSYERFLGHIVYLAWWQLQPYYLKDDEWSEPVWEIGKLVRNFFTELGFSEDVSKGFSKIVMCILEFDNAYRHRVQDLLGMIRELNRQTLLYILKVYTKRESILGAAQKINRIGKVLSYLLWIPIFKRALKQAHKGIDFKKIALDENDRYHTSYWRGYNYGGKDFDSRYQFFLDTHKGGFPPFRKREDPELTAKFLTE